MPQEAGERSAKCRRGEERLRSASSLCLCIPPKGAQEYRALVPEDGIQAWPPHTHACDEIVDRDAVEAFRPEHPGRFFQRVPLVEATWASTRPLSISKHSVLNPLTPTSGLIYYSTVRNYKAALPCRTPSTFPFITELPMEHSLALVTGTTSGLGYAAARTSCRRRLARDHRHRAQPASGRGNGRSARG